MSASSQPTPSSSTASLLLLGTCRNMTLEQCSNLRYTFITSTTMPGDTCSHFGQLDVTLMTPSWVPRSSTRWSGSVASPVMCSLDLENNRRVPLCITYAATALDTRAPPPRCVCIASSSSSSSTRPRVSKPATQCNNPKQLAKARTTVPCVGPACAAGCSPVARRQPGYWLH